MSDPKEIRFEVEEAIAASEERLLRAVAAMLASTPRRGRPESMLEPPERDDKYAERLLAAGLSALKGSSS